MTNMQRTTLQEVYFDLCDLLESNFNQLADIEIEGFSEFETLIQFLEEQKTKLEESNLIEE